jgi:hypothetical protein
MLSLEKFSCQFSMEPTRGQYCSSLSMAGTTAWGWPNYPKVGRGDSETFMEE